MNKGAQLLKIGLERIMKEREWKPKDLAKALKMKQPHVSRMFSEKASDPRLVTLIGYAEALKVPVAELLRSGEAHEHGSEDEISDVDEVCDNSSAQRSANPKHEFTSIFVGEKRRKGTANNHQSNAGHPDQDSRSEAHPPSSDANNANLKNLLGIVATLEENQVFKLLQDALRIKGEALGRSGSLGDDPVEKTDVGTRSKG